jgi:hypothetical protein
MTDEIILEPNEFSKSFGESLDLTLNIDTWSSHADLLQLYDRLAETVLEAVKQEDEIRKRIRKVVFPILSTRPNAAPGAGVYQATAKQIEHVHTGLLFNGGVEACDGNSFVDDRLPLTITQIGVTLVSYHGEQGSWAHRLFRRDLLQHNENIVDQTVALLEQRSKRDGIGIEEKQDQLSNLARRGIMTYAERAILLRHSDKPWRMGHGNPAAYELLTGSGMMELLDKSLDIMNGLLGDHKKYVFVPSTTAIKGRLYPTLGDALNPLEYAVVESAHEYMLQIVENGHYASRWKDKARDFTNTVGPSILMGVYRTNLHAPAQIFFAHKDYVHTAALIAMADSVLQEHRGFPTLIDIADKMCRSLMGIDSFAPSVETAYLDAQAPFSYSPERTTR